MELTIKDRVLILNTVLPQFDTRKNMELKISIANKIMLSDSENKEVVATPVGNGQIDISFKSAEAITGLKTFDLTDDELMYLKQRVDFIDRNGMFSAETISTYMKVLDEPFISSEKQAEWNKIMGIEPDPIPE